MNWAEFLGEFFMIAPIQRHRAWLREQEAREARDKAWLEEMRKRVNRGAMPQ
jgi:hypothetical protein